VFENIYKSIPVRSAKIWHSDITCILRFYNTPYVLYSSTNCDGKCAFKYAHRYANIV
jgi:hypothetical protein